MSDISQNSEIGEVDFAEVARAVWGEKIAVISIVLLMILGSIAVALLLPQKFKSTAIVAPIEQSSSGVGALVEQYNSLASIAGLNVGSNTSVVKADLALQILGSQKFLTEFIERRELLPYLLAFDHWDPTTDQIHFDSTLRDPKTGNGQERNSVSNGRSDYFEAYQAFSESMEVKRDQQTSFISISVEYYSPSLARQWVELLINDINENLRLRDIEEATKSIRFLEQKIAENTIADLNATFFELMQGQIQTVMLASAKTEYVFTTVDPAMTPELRSWPNRRLIVTLGLLVGLVLAFMYVLLQHFRSTDARNVED